jgi:hypothetical protein
MREGGAMSRPSPFSWTSSTVDVSEREISDHDFFADVISQAREGYPA